MLFSQKDRQISWKKGFLDQIPESDWELLSLRSFSTVILPIGPLTGNVMPALLPFNTFSDNFPVSEACIGFMLVFILSFLSLSELLLNRCLDMIVLWFSSVVPSSDLGLICFLTFVLVVSFVSALLAASTVFSLFLSSSDIFTVWRRTKDPIRLWNVLRSALFFSVSAAGVFWALEMFINFPSKPDTGGVFFTAGSVSFWILLADKAASGISFVSFGAFSLSELFSMWLSSTLVSWSLLSCSILSSLVLVSWLK